MVGQNTTVNMSLFLALTARHTMGVGFLWRFWIGAEEEADDWGEVVTRYPDENVGMDYLSKYIKRVIKHYIKDLIYYVFCLLYILSL